MLPLDAEPDPSLLVFVVSADHEKIRDLSDRSRSIAAR
jgi:hypothetical protein